jgi:mRNA-degrading endonuclease toxin of MazEF toxin-antitoxin module
LLARRPNLRSDSVRRTGTAITGTIRDLPTEVPLGRAHGLARKCVANCDNLFTIPKQAVGRRRGELDPESAARLRTALLIALDLEEP